MSSASFISQWAILRFWHFLYGNHSMTRNLIKRVRFGFELDQLLHCVNCILFFLVSIHWHFIQSHRSYLVYVAILMSRSRRWIHIRITHVNVFYVEWIEGNDLKNDIGKADRLSLGFFLFLVWTTWYVIYIQMLYYVVSSPFVNILCMAASFLFSIKLWNFPFYFDRTGFCQIYTIMDAGLCNAEIQFDTRGYNSNMSGIITEQSNS